MIDREKVLKAIEAVEAIEDISNSTITIGWTGIVRISTWAKDYGNFSEETKRQVLATLTPFVGKLKKTNTMGNDIDFSGEANGFDVLINKIASCKIVGYKKTVHLKPKTVEVPGEFEEVVGRSPITDCDLKAGTYSTEDIDEIPLAAVPEVSR